MGKFDPAEKEINLQSHYFIEAAELLGTKIKIALMVDFEKDLYKDPTFDRTGGEDLDIILNERPNRKYLESLGWFNEDSEVVPIIAYIGKKDNNGDLIKVTIGSLIRLPYELGEDEDYKFYLITDMVSESIGTVWWTCKLTPYKSEFSQTHTEDQDSENFKHIKVDK